MPGVLDTVLDTSLIRARGLATGAIRGVRIGIARVVAAYPRGAGAELAGAVDRLRKVRTPRDAVAAFETETERLLTVVLPMFVEHPLPLRRRAPAKAVLAGVGGLAAAGEELETIAALSSGGMAVPHTLPLVIGANLTALAVEISVAASLRVHALRAAGIEPGARDVAVDVVTAMTGRPVGAGGLTRSVTKRMVQAVAARVLSRWGAAFVPVAGIAYSGWDAQRTVDAVLALPVTGRPAAEVAPADSRPGVAWVAP